MLQHRCPAGGETQVSPNLVRNGKKSLKVSHFPALAVGWVSCPALDVLCSVIDCEPDKMRVPFPSLPTRNQTNQALPVSPEASIPCFSPVFSLHSAFSEMRSVGCGGRGEVPDPTAHTRGVKVWLGDQAAQTGTAAAPLEPALGPAPLALSTIIPTKHGQEAKCSFVEARKQNWKVTLCFYPSWKHRRHL